MNNFFLHTFFGLIFLIFQGLFLNNVNLFEWLNPFLYIYFIVYYPLKNNRIIFILISFLYGLIQDFFSDTHAIHSAACLIIAYFRPVFLKLYFVSFFISCRPVNAPFAITKKKLRKGFPLSIHQQHVAEQQPEDRRRRRPK